MIEQFIDDKHVQLTIYDLVQTQCKQSFLLPTSALQTEFAPNVVSCNSMKHSSYGLIQSGPPEWIHG